MKITVTALMLLAAASQPAFASDRLSAAAMPGVGLKHAGKVLIANDRSSITAFVFVGNIRDALFSLRSARSLSYTSFGDAVFNSKAHLAATASPEMKSLIEEAAVSAGVDPRLVYAVSARESAHNPNAMSPVGACGLMQLMPATAKYLGVTDIFNPRQNVFAGARYLRTLLDTFHGDLDLTLAAYNAGPGAVAKHNGVPPFRETQQYVAAVRASYERSIR